MNEIRRQRKLFWSYISQTVSVLVLDSARLSAGEIVVDLLAGCLACPNRITEMAKLVAFVACAYGYAEGGLLAREMGGWRVICWALVTVLPFELVALVVYWSGNGVRFEMANADAWAALFYLTAVSQFIGFFFYYKGLALGGIAKMSQVQLLLPFMAIFAAHWILGEQIDGSVIVGTLAITAIVVAGGKSVSTYRRTLNAEHRTLNEPNAS